MLYKDAPEELSVIASKELLNAMPNRASYIIYVTGIEDAIGFSEVKPMSEEQKITVSTSKHPYYLIPINEIACKCVAKYIENIR
jgi:hypothetical protein